MEPHHQLTNAGSHELPPSGTLIILPVLNEVDHIDILLRGVATALQDRPYTVCVIDDGSTDGTVEKLRAALAKNPARLHLMQRKKLTRGSQRGGALKAGLEWGLEHTQHQVFVEMDGDLSHRPEELPVGIRFVEEGYDVAIASKYAPGSQVVNRPVGRRLVSHICSIAVGTVIAGRIKDYSNGYRFYTRAAAAIIARHRIRYGSPIYLTEVLSLWLRNGLRIREFPSVYIGRNEGLSKLRPIDLLKASIGVFEIGLRYHILGFDRCAERADAAAVSDVETLPS